MLGIHFIGFKFGCETLEKSEKQLLKSEELQQLYNLKHSCDMFYKILRFPHAPFILQQGVLSEKWMNILSRFL